MFILAACQSPENNSASDGAITACKADPSLKNYNDLLVTANTAIDKNSTLDVDLVLKTFEVIRSSGKTESGVEWIKEILKKNDAFDGREKVLVAYADAWEKDLKKPTQASIIRQGILQTTPDLPALSTQKSSLAGLPRVNERIRGFAEKIFSGESGDFNPKIAASFVPACENYALALPKDSLSPNFLIDAATIARNLNQTEKVLELFKWVYNKYPDSPKAGDAKFSEAFTYDNDLKDFDRAKVAYEAFLAEYPNHPFAPSAQVMLKNLGKSDEQIIRELEAASQSGE